MNENAMIAFYDIDRLVCGRIGTFDVACPFCGPHRHSRVNQRKKVFRVWRIEPAFASYHCVRCGEKGFARDRKSVVPDPVKLAKARAEAAQRDQDYHAKRLRMAQWLWSQRESISGTIAETYLRLARGYRGPLPTTLGFLPARGDYPPAMIAAFGLPSEPEPGRLVIADHAVRGVHLTRLLPDGSGKAVFSDEAEQAKVMIGRSTGWPIVLAPCNDLLGLAIVEGVEDGLSAYEATQLGVWAAGSASRLPALAGAIPAYIECVTLLIDDDPDGRRHAATLASLIAARGIEVRSIVL
jgi:hypothetical protein